MAPGRARHLGAPVLEIPARPAAFGHASNGYRAAVLAMTDQAVEVIKNIVAESEIGPEAGLRISGANEGNGEAALEFELAEKPEDGDEVVREDGAVVFLDETAAKILADKTLDVHSHGDHFHFSLDEQNATS